MRRRWVRLGAAIVAVAALAVGGWLGRSALGGAWDWASDDGVAIVEGWTTKLRSIADEIPEREVEVRSAVTESRSALLVLGNGPGTAAFALLSVAPEGDAALTLIPQRMLGIVPGYGNFRLDQGLGFEGAELAALTVINRFGIRIDDVVALQPGELAAAVGPPLIVDVPIALFVQEGDSAQRIVPDGRQAVDGAVAEVLLTTKGAGDMFEWLQRQGSVWRAILERAVEEPDLADRITAGAARPRVVADLLVAVAAAEELHVATIPVETASGIDGETVFLASSSADDFVRERFDHLLLRDVRPPVEVLNGNGRIGATRVVAGNLVRLGFRVVRTDNADRFDFESTEVIAQGRKGEAAAWEVLDALGTGTVFIELRAPSSVVDVTIIVGQDIPAGEG
jgi:hypothetical protein